MELNEEEKRQLFQVDGDCQAKVLDELYMTARFTRNPEQRDMVRGLMAKLRVLSDEQCMDLVKDIQKNYHLPYGYERVDELVELMLQTVLSQRPYIRIAGDDYPREVVKSRFLKVNFSHVEYVFDCLDNNTTKVRNIKSYLLAALYNAPTTMDSYYRAEVNHDLYG